MTISVETLKSLDNPEQWIAPGETRRVRLQTTENFIGTPVRVPVAIKRGRQPGPKVFITAALHGNEINGTGAIRDLITDPEFQLETGFLFLVPVVNVLGFERHSRYLPDRRDLNRCFPGSASGSLASRMAHAIFEQVIRRCDFGIDLHTAAVRRTNFPNVRGDLTHADVRQLAMSFGCQWIVTSKGPRGALRREATRAGVPTIILEAGEVWKVEPGVVSVAHRGIKNVLSDLGMIRGTPEVYGEPVVLKRTKWTRADHGGFLQFHTSPGRIVERNQPLATCTSLLGAERSVIHAPFHGVVIGMTTVPAVSPGEPVCHVGQLDRSTIRRLASLHHRDADPMAKQLRTDLATNVNVVEHGGEHD